MRGKGKGPKRESVKGKKERGAFEIKGDGGDGEVPNGQVPSCWS